MFDVITIGSATQDIFIESDNAKILTLKDPLSKESYLCFEYGSKIDFDKFDHDVGGGAINTAVNFANLGLNTATIVKLGKDVVAKAVLHRLEDKNINESLVIRTKEHKTGFSVILTSFEGDRTVLTHRGANNHMRLDEMNWDVIKNSGWVYIAPLSGGSNSVLDTLAQFAEEHGISMAFNPGSAQIKRGIEDLRKILSAVRVLIMNKEEASHITGMHEEENIIIHDMLIKLKSYGPKIVVITDGGNGVQAYDGKTFYQAPAFPAHVVSSLGAGDAFASTFVASLIKYNWDIEKAIIYASINSASIVESFGAQKDLLTFEEIEQRYNKHQDFEVSKKVYN